MNKVPNHIGIIPDGNRRWACENGLEKQDGYDAGLNPGLELYKLCRANGISEITYYGFTQDNTKRPKIQVEAFQKACVKAVEIISKEDAELLVVGNYDSPMFPKELLPFTKRTTFGSGGIKVNFLVNYGWQWDLSPAIKSISSGKTDKLIDSIHSSDISRIDMIIRWGGRRRLSGFLPIQSVYADFFVIEDFWPDFKTEHFYNALSWYDAQDVTLGG